MRKSICIIDDDQIYQIIVKKIISKADAFGEIFQYLNCWQAITDFEAPGCELPSLILLDINLPVIDGWQFLEHLTRCRPNLSEETSIYIVTSSIAYSDKLKANLYKEVSGFISKPLTVGKLQEIAAKL